MKSQFIAHSVHTIGHLKGNKLELKRIPLLSIFMQNVEEFFLPQLHSHRYQNHSNSFGIQSKGEIYKTIIHRK